MLPRCFRSGNSVRQHRTHIFGRRLVFEHLEGRRMLAGVSYPTIVAVTADYDTPGNGNFVCGTYLPNVSLSNQFTVELKGDYLCEFGVEYRFGSEGEFKKVASVGADCSRARFTVNMGDLNPDNSLLQVRVVDLYAFSTETRVVKTESVSIEWQEGLPFELTYDTIDVADARLIDQVGGNSLEMKATLPSSLDFFDQYKHESLQLELKPKGGVRGIKTLTPHGDGSYTVQASLSEFHDVNLDGKDYDLGLKGTRGEVAKVFTESKELLVVPIPEWMKDFEVVSKSYDQGHYKLDLKGGWGLKSPEIIPSDPYGLLNGTKSQATIDVMLDVDASLDYTSADSPTAKFKSGSLDVTLLGEELLTKTIAQAELPISTSLTAEKLELTESFESPIRERCNLSPEAQTR